MQPLPCPFAKGRPRSLVQPQQRLKIRSCQRVLDPRHSPRQLQPLRLIWPGIEQSANSPSQIRRPADVRLRPLIVPEQRKHACCRRNLLPCRPYRIKRYLTRKHSCDSGLYVSIQCLAARDSLVTSHRILATPCRLFPIGYSLFLRSGNRHAIHPQCGRGRRPAKHQVAANRCDVLQHLLQISGNCDLVYRVLELAMLDP